MRPGVEGEVGGAEEDLRVSHERSASGSTSGPGPASVGTGDRRRVRRHPRPRDRRAQHSLAAAGTLTWPVGLLSERVKDRARAKIEYFHTGQYVADTSAQAERSRRLTNRRGHAPPLRRQRWPVVPKLSNGTTEATRQQGGLTWLEERSSMARRGGHHR